METGSIRALAQEALEALPKPYGVDVIDDVFHTIETRPEWRKRYDSLCDEGTKTTVNTWLARIVSELLGKRGQRSVRAQKSTLINTYSLLDTDAKTLARKPKADEAARQRWEYWQVHKDTFTEPVRRALYGHTKLIDSLIMDGCTPGEAFNTVVANIEQQ